MPDFSSPRKNRRTIPIFVPGRRNPVGRVRGDTFLKEIRQHHFLSSPPAIAFEAGSLETAAQAGATQVQITNSETGAIYCAPIDTILTDGFTFDRGWGQQVALRLERWSRLDIPRQTQLFAQSGNRENARSSTGDDAQPAAFRQLDLFGESGT